MKNRIVIVGGNDENMRIEARAFDQDNINKFGLLQEIITPDNEEQNYNTLVQNRLTEANRVTTSLSAELLGDDRIQKGILIPIRDERVNINGIYVVKSSSHKVNNGVHTVKCDLDLQE